MKKVLLVTVFLNAVFNAAAYDGKWEKFDAVEMRCFLQQFIKPGDLVFDVGAHVGNRTELYLACGADVVCFEPQPELTKALRKKFEKNQHVRIEQLGLGAQLGIMDMYLCDSTTLSTFSFWWVHNSRFARHGYKWTKKIQVNIATLDLMIAKYGIPQFCKIDVEGFECAVLQGLSQKIPYISIEYTVESIDNTKQCLDHLVKLGYTQFNFAIGEKGWLFFSEWLSHEQLLQSLSQIASQEYYAGCWGLWGDIYAR